MTQEIIVWALLMGLIGLIWVVVLAILDENYHCQNGWPGNASSKQTDARDQQEPSPGQPRVAA